MNMNATESLQSGYFDDVYAAHADPWGFETGAYERDNGPVVTQ